MKRGSFLLWSLLGAAPALAGEFDTLGNLTQSEFRALSEDLGAAAAYKGVTPATPLGLLGIDVGVEITATRLENSRLFSLAGSGSRSELVIPKFHVHKGLPAGFDIGAFIGSVPELGGVLYGAELRYALLDDTLSSPAVGLRAAGTLTDGLDEIDVRTASLDLVVSKKFTLATPYAGAGMVRIASEADGAGFGKQTLDKSRFFAGLNLNLALVNLAFEAEKLGSNTSLTAKLGWRF